MKTSFSCHALTGLAVVLLCPPLLQAGGELAHGERGIVATVHPLATDAAVETFKKGGNAIDAAVAAALTLGVVDGQNSGIGGGCFILIRLADGRFIAIDGRETAPADQSTCGVGSSTCSVCGSSPWRRAITVLMTLAIPAADWAWPMLDLTEPSSRACSGSRSRP